MICLGWNDLLLLLPTYHQNARRQLDGCVCIFVGLLHSWFGYMMMDNCFSSTCIILVFLLLSQLP